MKKTTLLGLTAIFLLSATSCVSKKKYNTLNGEYDQLRILYQQVQGDIKFCENELNGLKKELGDKDLLVKKLEDEIKYLKNSNTQLLSTMSDLQIVSKTGAESIKKSLEVLNEQSKYIKDLNQNIQRKDSINLTLVSNLKRSLADVNDEDVQVEVRGGVVYVSISDKLLFKSGSSAINPDARKVLEKVSRVINDHKELNVMVQGHTDDVPIATECVADNWDLSVKRATSVVRILQNDFKVSPDRLTAAGNGEYQPKTSNENASNRRLNRRTEIILTPKLDQFFDLATPKSGK